MQNTWHVKTLYKNLQIICQWPTSMYQVMSINLMISQYIDSANELQLLLKYM